MQKYENSPSTSYFVDTSPVENVNFDIKLNRLVSTLAVDLSNHTTRTQTDTSPTKCSIAVLSVHTFLFNIEFNPKRVYQRYSVIRPVNNPQNSR